MRPVLFCAVAVCWAGNLPAPDQTLLARIQAHVTENLAHLPDYTCTRTIERAARRNANDPYRTSDLVRLEVAYVDQKELFGYPGGEQLDEAEVSRLVPGGVIGSGDFALLARDVFANPGVKYTLTEAVKYAGRPAIRCDYQVPASASSYRLRVPPHDAVVGYHGTFWVDEATLDLIRFEVTADHIPLVLGLGFSRVATDYEQVTFGGNKFSLPQSSELLVSGISGWQSRNRTRFSACRQFLGESVIHFDDGAAAGAAIVAAPVARHVLSVKLPRDFSAALTLESPLDSAAAAIGDPVRFHLEHDLKRRNVIIVPKGATFNGRIVRLEHSEDRFDVAFRLESVEFGSFRADLRTRRNVFSMNDHSHFTTDEQSSLAFGALPREDKETGALITVLTDHLRWPKGFHFSLRSHLP